MNEDDTRTQVLDESPLREIVTGEAPPEGAPGRLRMAPRRRPHRGESGEGGEC
jgi:hypothetical protein